MLVAGVDEAGRGPLAGPVISAAVILKPNSFIEGVQDSKRLKEHQREALFDSIQREALAFAIGRAEVEEIDRFNILQASLLSMKRAIEGLGVRPDRVLVDGNHKPNVIYPTESIIKGDSLVASISAASILAKVTRDREMVVLDRQYPGYGFAKHKGYPTKEHYEALRQQGPCEIHRRTFAPVRELMV